MDRLRHQTDAEGGADAVHGIEARLASGAKRFIQSFLDRLHLVKATGGQSPRVMLQTELAHYSLLHYSLARAIERRPAREDFQKQVVRTVRAA